MIIKDAFFIGGALTPPLGSSSIELIEPHTEKAFARVPLGSTADIDRAVHAARTAFDDGPWPRMSARARGEILAALAASLQGRADEIGAVISRENGTPITFSRMAQVFGASLSLDYYAGLLDSFAFEDQRVGMTGRNVVQRSPIGVVAAVVPWNAPLVSALLKVAPALAAGCTAVLKPSPETALDAYYLAECAVAAGVPAGVLNIVAADRDVSETLVTHPGVDKVSFTGSTAAGRRIAALCGERLRPCTLELGGKSAAIVLEDVDFAAMAQGLIVDGSFAINGQACVSNSRILAPASHYAEVVDAVSECVAALRVGDPLDDQTQIGPLVSRQQQQRVLGYIEAGVRDGAKVVVGGGVPRRQPVGWFVEPTVFAGVDNAMTIAQEEIFGPVLAVIPYTDVDNAVRLANDSVYGLSGSVWTDDLDMGMSIARRVQTGSFGLNGGGADPGSPFGGVKDSGIGRENGPEGMAEYLYLKNICLNQP